VNLGQSVTWIIAIGIRILKQSFVVILIAILKRICNYAKITGTAQGH